MDEGLQPRLLQPLAYHHAVVEYLKGHEREVWMWAASLEAREDAARELRAELLRDTYRLTDDAHPEVHAAARAVLQTLAVDAPITLYQGGDGPMNAALRYLPGEVHVVFQGPVLERLSSGELTALLGHEIAHYRLWSEGSGEHYCAARILDHVLSAPGAAPSHIETARLHALNTELYADRGGALAAGDPAPAVSTLVKVQTGLSNVDPAAYVAQAGELDALADDEARRSRGFSHPEIYLRAQALDRWWRGEADLEPWLAARLGGTLDLARLDLPGQLALSDLTRRFIARYLGGLPEGGGEAVMAQVRAYFPDWRAGEALLADDETADGRLAPSVREYLGSVLADLALADRDLRDEALAAAARMAADTGGLDAFATVLRRDVGLTKREVDRLTAAAKTAARANA